MSDIALVVSVTPGADIRDAGWDAIELSRRVGVPVQFRFNGVLIHLNSRHTRDDAARQLEQGYDLERRLNERERQGRASPAPATPGANLEPERSEGDG